MFKIIILITFIFSTTIGIAQANTFGALGASGRFLKKDDGNYNIKFPILIYDGYKKIPWAYGLEGLYFKDTSNAGSAYKITNNHYEATLYALRFFNYEDARAINPYMVAGLGGFQSRVSTDFGGSYSNDKSKINVVAKVGAGAWAQLGARGFLMLEGKGIYSRYFSPDLVFDLSIRAGLEF